jgi:hypothetical protein
MVTLWGLPSAGVRSKILSVGDHDIRWAPLVRGISFLDGIHVEEFYQNIWGITGHFLDDAASHNDGDAWWHILPSYTGDGLRLIRKLPGCI